MSKTIYGYARVSTPMQSLESQKEALMNHGVEKTNLFAEKFTGTQMNRPAFNLLLETVQVGDMVIATEPFFT